MTDEQDPRPTVANGRNLYSEHHGRPSAQLADVADEGDETPSNLAPSPTVADGIALHRLTHHRPDDAA